ncbi:hypothetical protein SAMN02910317_00806 [Ruminococcaceae bacterium FB2012]|nr:hypothetical protein SAMN02910317_00806 [Ruminococcaceae bacterium FB2012]
MNVIYKNGDQLFLIGFEALQAEAELKVRNLDGVLVILPTTDFEFDDSKYSYFLGLSDLKLKNLLIDWLDKLGRNIMIFLEISNVYYLYDPGDTDFALCALTNMCKQSSGKDNIVIRVV